MANSDNVIRAGLTPKLRDIPNLLAGLTYSFGLQSQHAVQPQPFPPSPDSIGPLTNGTLFYNPPVPEFSVLRTVVQCGHVETHRPIHGPSIAIVTEGEGFVRWGGNGDTQSELNVSLGHVFFTGAGTELTFESGAREGPLMVYRAFVEVI